VRTTLFLLVALAGLGTVAVAVSRLMRLVRGSVLCRLPLVEQQTFLIEEPGSIVMSAEAPLAQAAFRGNTSAVPPAFRGLTYTVSRIDSGEELRLGGVLTAAVATSFGSTRVPVARLRLDRPGELSLTVGNLAASPEADRCGLVFTRSQGLAMPLTILAVVFGGVLLIAGTVFTILSVSGAL